MSQESVEIVRRIFAAWGKEGSPLAGTTCSAIRAAAAASPPPAI
jgi:hypothetical protein